MSQKFYATTAIPYVNAAPHLGFALELVQADVIARYRRLLGEDVFALTGADENALKNAQAAEEAGVPVRELVDENAAKFKELAGPLNLSFDSFIHTSDPDKHWPGAIKIWNKCLENGDIYQKDYEGLYCVGCEDFKMEKDLIDGLCPEHQKAPKPVKERNYFFRLSKYQDQLVKLIESGRYKIVPDSRQNEALAFIKGGLEDFSVSRSRERARSWGIPVPGDDSQIIYVWFDALINYLTGLGYGSDDESLFDKYWPADVHVIGKGILKFHAIYWPAMLLSAGIEPPRELFVHGYITIEGQKISKSLGNVIDPLAVVEEFGTDAIRYYLLRAITAYGDGDFSRDRFVEVYNADLANGLGNLCARVLKMVEKFCDGKVPTIVSDPDGHPLRVGEGLYTWKDAYRDRDLALAEHKFNEALEAIWRFIATADKYIDENKPWELAKTDSKKLSYVLYGLLDGLHQVVWQIAPFLPETSRKIATALGIESLLKDNPNEKDSWTNLEFGQGLKPLEPLFPRMQ